jgi:hypothetical protein
VIGCRVERRRAVERGNQFTAVVERHAIAATSDTVNTRDCAGMPRTSARFRGGKGQPQEKPHDPDARGAIASWRVASRLPPCPPDAGESSGISSNLVTTHQISANLGE